MDDSVQARVNFILKYHKKTGESGWSWCSQCRDAYHGASESLPKWPCDAYALARLIIEAGGATDVEAE